MLILAVKTHHCSLKIRARFYFESPLDETAVNTFKDRGWNVEWNRFSQFHPNSKDHYKIIKDADNPIRISGVVDEKAFDVFFGRVGVSTEKEDTQLLSEFTQLLINLGFGDEVVWQDQS